MSATLRADDPRGAQIRSIRTLTSPAPGGGMDAEIDITWWNGRHWHGTASGWTCHEAAVAVFSLAREEGVE